MESLTHFVPPLLRFPSESSESGTGDRDALPSVLRQRKDLLDVPDQGGVGPDSTTRSLSGAFLNIPYDVDFQSLYLAHIAGITAFGLRPRATLEIPGGARRLDRIFDLIKSCRYSFHDLSRVELDVRRPATPRFNMPFELGLAVAWDKLNAGQHVWFVLEAKSRRAGWRRTQFCDSNELN
jgi:hypothetical protein